MQAAFSAAESFLSAPITPSVQVRMALHWGAVKTGPDGDVLGTEVHKACRIEGVKSADLKEPVIEKDRLPMENRILISKQGLDRSPKTLQSQFIQAGKFHLKGFTKLHELWVYSG
jgi:class 3 adenylate cyclase